MSYEITIAILSSTLLATIFSSLIGLFKSKKDDNLRYISEERTKWRAELRKIAEEINLATLDNLSEPLTKLKVRINAYGLANGSKQSQDSSLWMLLEFYDENKVPEKNIQKFKNQLINFISLLLKSDWERYKREVKGWEDSILEKILFCLIVVIYSMGFKWAFHKYYIMVVLCLSMFYFILYVIRNRFKAISIDSLKIIEKNCVEVLEKKKKNHKLNIKSEMNKINSVIKMWDIVVLVLFIVIPCVGLYYYYRNMSLIFIWSSLLIYSTCIVSGLAYWIWIWLERVGKKIESDEYFVNCIIEISQKLDYIIESEN